MNGDGKRSTTAASLGKSVAQVNQLSLSLIPGQEGGSPPQSVPGSPRGVVGPCWTVLPARCPFWPAHELSNGGPGALPSRQRRCSMDRWQSPGARSGEDSMARTLLFMSCIFMSCILHVLQFHALKFRPFVLLPAISRPAFSAPPSSLAPKLHQWQSWIYSVSNCITSWSSLPLPALLCSAFNKSVDCSVSCVSV